MHIRFMNMIILTFILFFSLSFKVKATGINESGTGFTLNPMVSGENIDYQVFHMTGKYNPVDRRISVTGKTYSWNYRTLWSKSTCPNNEEKQAQLGALIPVIDELPQLANSRIRPEAEFQTISFSD